MNKLKKIIKKYKKLTESHHEAVLVLEETKEGLRVIMNGDNGVEDSQVLDISMAGKLKELLNRDNIEFYTTQEV